MRAVSRPSKRWRMLAVLPLLSGAALVVHVLTRISLGTALLVAGALIVAFSIVVWRRLTPSARQAVSWRVKAGALAGLPALVAYDGTRWTLITVFHYTVWPFDIFSIFGQAIAGPNTPAAVAIVLGVLYHMTNGLFFAIAYAILFAPRPWWVGVLWALGLEAMMLAVYPGWLHPSAFGEFLSLSMLGHLAYGSVLGVISRWSVLRQARQTKTSVKSMPSTSNTSELQTPL